MQLINKYQYIPIPAEENKIIRYYEPMMRYNTVNINIFVRGFL